MKGVILLSICLVLSNYLFAQSVIRGRIIDKSTGKTMPFVNIVYNSNKEGLTSNIDGEFSINNSSKVEFLQFSYVGYKTVTIPKNSISTIPNGIIFLQEQNHNLREVIVHPGENPAHRIIKLTVKNRKLNNPNKLKSYSYTAYHKMVFTIDTKNVKQNSAKIKNQKVDSSLIKMNEFIDKQHLFLMESVSEKKFKFPAQHSEKIIASRVSGFKEPSMVLLANQLQSFSFYENIITLAESRYINPISPGSTKKYFFNIEDTSYTERGDTIFSISFKPKKKKNFEALSGVLQINTYKYAVQSVNAKPVEAEGQIGIEIQQQYKLIDNKHWFPFELNTKLIFNGITIDSENSDFTLLGIGKSYIRNIKINKEIKRKEIGKIDFEVSKIAHKQSDSLWNKYRHDTLSKKELTTYTVLDSIGKEHKLDLKLKTYKAWSKGYIPVSFLNIDISKALDFNIFEGFRPGIGLFTNDKLIKNISIGGYFAYGFNDTKIKYGSNLDFTISVKQDIKLSINYKKDVMESSGYQFIEEPSISSTESYRYFENSEIRFQFRPFRKFKSVLSINQSNKKNNSDYYFNNNVADDPMKTYKFAEASVKFAYTPNEILFYIDNELLNSYGSSPAFYANITKGFKNNFGDFDFWKVETKVLLSTLTKNFGKTDLVISAAKVFGNLPYFELYNGHASYYDFTIETANSFATMRMNEFLSDKFIAFYLRQDFGSLLFKTKKFKPEILLITSVAYGSLEKPEQHKGIDFKTMEKGFFESGILFNNLIKSANIMGLGFGVYYRYGSYTFANTSENFAYKLSVTFDL